MSFVNMCFTLMNQMPRFNTFQSSCDRGNKMYDWKTSLRWAGSLITADSIMIGYEEASLVVNRQRLGWAASEAPPVWGFGEERRVQRNLANYVADQIKRAPKWHRGSRMLLFSQADLKKVYDVRIGLQMCHRSYNPNSKKLQCFPHIYFT